MIRWPTTSTCTPSAAPTTRTSSRSSRPTYPFNCHRADRTTTASGTTCATRSTSTTTRLRQATRLCIASRSRPSTRIRLPSSTPASGSKTRRTPTPSSAASTVAAPSRPSSPTASCRPTTWVRVPFRAAQGSGLPTMRYSHKASPTLPVASACSRARLTIRFSWTSAASSTSATHPVKRATHATVSAV